LTFFANHGFDTGDQFTLTFAAGATANNLNAGTPYYVVKVSDTALRLATSRGDAYLLADFQHTVAASNALVKVGDRVQMANGAIYQYVGAADLASANLADSTQHYATNAASWKFLKAPVNIEFAGGSGNVSGVSAATYSYTVPVAYEADLSRDDVDLATENYNNASEWLLLAVAFDLSAPGSFSAVNLSPGQIVKLANGNLYEYTGAFANGVNLTTASFVAPNWTQITVDHTQSQGIVNLEYLDVIQLTNGSLYQYRLPAGLLQAHASFGSGSYNQDYAFQYSAAEKTALIEARTFSLGPAAEPDFALGFQLPLPRCLVLRLGRKRARRRRRDAEHLRQHDHARRRRTGWRRPGVRAAGDRPEGGLRQPHASAAGCAFARDEGRHPGGRLRGVPVHRRGRFGGSAESGFHECRAVDEADAGAYRDGCRSPAGERRHERPGQGPDRAKRGRAAAVRPVPVSRRHGDARPVRAKLSRHAAGLAAGGAVRHRPGHGCAYDQRTRRSRGRPHDRRLERRRSARENEAQRRCARCGVDRFAREHSRRSDHVARARCASNRRSRSSTSARTRSRSAHSATCCCKQAARSPDRPAARWIPPSRSVSRSPTTATTAT
jgi:hypothetical protein